MEVKEVLFMNKGEGENSHVQNSRFPQIVASKAKPALEVAVQSLFSEEFEFLGKRVVKVADLGCWVGSEHVFCDVNCDGDHRENMQRIEDPNSGTTNPFERSSRK